MGGLENILGRAARTTCRARRGRSGRRKPVSFSPDFLPLPLCPWTRKEGCRLLGLSLFSIRVSSHPSPHYSPQRPWGSVRCARRSNEECILGQEAAGREGCLPTDTPLSSARPRPSRAHPDHGFPEPSIYVLSAAPRGLQGLMECERGLGFFILFSAVQIPHTFPFHSGSKFRTSKIAGLQGGGRDFTSRERQGPSQRLPP